MKLGIGSYTFPWAIGVAGHPPERPMGPLDLLGRAAELGVRVVQVADNLPLDRLPPADLAAFEARAAELRIQVEVGTRGIDRGRLLACLALAERFRSRILRVVVDTPDSQPSEDEIVAALRGLAPDLERAGVTLAVENHDRFPARDLARIIGEAGSVRVGVCLDTVNSFGTPECLETVLEALGFWVVSLHVKDFAIFRAPHQMGFTIEGRPAGQGRLDIPWLLGELKARGRDPNAILELWTPPEPTLPATIAREAAWAEESVRALRQWIKG